MSTITWAISMKQKHIINIGHPKCGTTWLWKQLDRHPAVTSGILKENNMFLNTVDIAQYKNYYNQYDITTNFHITQWAMDQAMIQQLGTCTTHASVILRNPYDFIERWKDWLEVHDSIKPYKIYNTKFSDLEFVDWCLTSNIIQYAEIVSRWTRNLVSAKFKVFLYEDLKKDSAQFLSNYFDFCGLENIKIPDSEQPVNVNPNTVRKKLSFDKNQISTINNEIKMFEELIERDLTHWLNFQSP